MAIIGRQLSVSGSVGFLWHCLLHLVPGSTIVREYVWLECTETGDRNYRVSKETRGTERLELKKYCPRLRRHTIHKESRKK
jgi:large subunit ribosomal protein L33